MFLKGAALLLLLVFIQVALCAEDFYKVSCMPSMLAITY